MSKVAVIWSSPNNEGLTASAKNRVIKGLTEAGAEVEEIQLNKKHVEHCRACGNGWGTCNKTGSCVIKDDFADIYKSLAEADGDKEKACTWTCYYESVIGFGKAEILTDSDERTKGLDAIMFHHGFNLPAGVKRIAYNAMELARTEVVKIDVAEITGKHHLKK